MQPITRRLLQASFISAIAIPSATCRGEIFTGSIFAVAEYAPSGALESDSFITSVSLAGFMQVYGADLFVANWGAGTIGEYTTAGGTVNASLVTGVFQDAPADFAVSGSDIFVVNNTAGTVSEYTTQGALVKPSLISGLTSPAGITVSGGNLFVTSFGARTGDGTVGEYTTSGATIDASLVSGLIVPQHIAVSGTDLFVMENNSISEYTTSGKMVTDNLVGQLASPTSIAVSGTTLFVVNLQALETYTTTGVPLHTPLVYPVDGSSVAVTAPGDANSDGLVNAQDIGVIASHWLNTGNTVSGDINGDGIVNAQDIALVASNWLAGSGAATTATAVPEPSAFILAALGALALLGLRLKT